MTKAATIHQFWSWFQLKAYEENAVPTGDNAPDFPYLTYSLVTDSFGDEVGMTASIWYRSSSWTVANAKAEEILKFIGIGGVMLDTDNGRIWIKRGSPFANRLSDESDTMIKRIIINISVEFFTND